MTVSKEILQLFFFLSRFSQYTANPYYTCAFKKMCQYMHGIHVQIKFLLKLNSRTSSYLCKNFRFEERNKSVSINLGQ